ncbi:hypothetical protein SASPL_139817 [Salvia splendens]|uniref:Protein phosphatase n=1 Tax=Salvia splendens TaxID=180675 RepID=A0A8X8WPN8_SALSN|nr:hypothetical protein SASPL_139817 [Salvia splendens]
MLAAPDRRGVTRGDGGQWAHGTDDRRTYSYRRESEPTDGGFRQGVGAAQSGGRRAAKGGFRFHVKLRFLPKLENLKARRERRGGVRHGGGRRWFNKPYQLERRVSSGPGLADEMAVEVEGVAATDGLFDSLFPEEEEAVMERCLSEGLEPEMVARELATAAYLKSKRRSAKTLFAVASAEAGTRRRWVGIGGKRDDITRPGFDSR